MRKIKSGECWSSIVMMSTRERLLAPAFGALMVRNLSPTAVDGESGLCPIDASWSARVEVERSVRSRGEVFPSRLSLGEEYR